MNLKAIIPPFHLLILVVSSLGAIQSKSRMSKVALGARDNFDRTAFCSSIREKRGSLIDDIADEYASELYGGKSVALDAAAGNHNDLRRSLPKTSGLDSKSSKFFRGARSANSDSWIGNEGREEPFDLFFSELIEPSNHAQHTQTVDPKKTLSGAILRKRAPSSKVMTEDEPGDSDGDKWWVLGFLRNAYQKFASIMNGDQEDISGSEGISNE